jgi:hypothetical protein
LFGRSLIYRWAVVLPLVMSYQRGMWPHSPGLLRRIVRGNIEFFWKAGAFDAERQKLRETFAPESSQDVRERYVDNGHPYWCMPAFSFLALKRDDPFWTEPEQPLPVERWDFATKYPALGMVVIGTKKSGQVRWLQSRNLHRPAYRDKYIKFGYSSHFPFNVTDDTNWVPWDNTLVFRNVLTGESAGRSAVKTGDLLLDGSLVTQWSAELDNVVFDVTTRVRPFDEFEERTHLIMSDATPEELACIEVLEGSYSHGLHDLAECEHRPYLHTLWSRNKRTGAVVFTGNLLGYEQLELATHFLAPDEKTNALFPHMAVNTLRSGPGHCTGTFVSLHYASPAPLSPQELANKVGIEK